ncbi:MAG: hypothetical protein KA198_02240 [Chitinophagaceae bacterium]|nr:hypothetical protein [Chitinophagaceae bacterium]
MSKLSCILLIYFGVFCATGSNVIRLVLSEIYHIGIENEMNPMSKNFANEENKEEKQSEKIENDDTLISNSSFLMCAKNNFSEIMPFDYFHFNVQIKNVLHTNLITPPPNSKAVASLTYYL